MSIEHAMLGLLSLRPLTGYDLKKMFAGSVALYWSGNNNQIYKALLGLHKEKLVVQEIQNAQSGPSRKVYTITKKGLGELKKWVLSEPEMPQLKHTFLIQLAWADQLTAEELEGLLSAYEAEVSAQLVMLRAQEQHKNLSPAGQLRDAYINVALARTPREARLWGLILKNWLAFYEHELSWVRQLRKALAEKE
jgi:PadR family transcriptional regulator AphA